MARGIYKHKKKYNITKQFLIKEYVNDKKSISNIAKKVGCSYTVVRDRLIEYNIHIRTIGEATKGHRPYFIAYGKDNPFHGKHHTIETKQKIRESNLKNPRKYWTGKKRDIKTAKMLRKAAIGHIPWNKNKKMSKETREKIRQASLKEWQRPGFREKMRHLFNHKITSLEQRIIKIIKKYSLSFKYVGKGDLIIHGFCPDFVNVNGKKQLIEVYANYWKIKDYGSVNRYKKIREAIFKRYGYETLFIGEKELKHSDKQIAQKIKKF